MKDFKLLLKEIRKSKNISQLSLAESLNTTQQQLSLYETNKRQIPLDKLVEIANILDVTLDELVQIQKLHEQKEE